MSIWGAGAEQNDDAANWLAELEDKPEARKVRSAIARVQKRKSYLDVDMCAEAIAAAHVLADACGVQGKSIVSKEALLGVRQGLQKLTTPQMRTLCKDARAAIASVRDNARRSELFQLWSEDKQLARWRANLDKLAQRLTRAPGALANVPVATKQMRQRKQCKVGAIVAIPLPNQRYAFARVFKDNFFGVYSIVSKKIEKLDNIADKDIAFFQSATTSAVVSGQWPILGELPFPDEESAT